MNIQNPLLSLPHQSCLDLESKILMTKAATSVDRTRFKVSFVNSGWSIHRSDWWVI
jgi:hypothetical protein